jgi:hypothetical protein
MPDPTLGRCDFLVCVVRFLLFAAGGEAIFLFVGFVIGADSIK